MNSKRTKTKTKNVEGGGLLKTRKQRKASSTPDFKVKRINSRFSWAADDCLSLTLKATNSSTGGTPAGSVFALDPTSITTSGYSSLGYQFPLIAAMSAAYSRFMVTNLKFTVISTTPITNGGYVALGYEPDNSSWSSPSTALLDVTTCRHSAVAQTGGVAQIDLDPSVYFVDWRPTVASASTGAPDNQAGIVQVLVNAGSTATSSVLIEVEVTIHFAGFRRGS